MEGREKRKKEMDKGDGRKHSWNKFMVTAFVAEARLM